MLATKNLHKVNEIRAILGQSSFSYLSLLDFPDIAEIDESGVTFAENALIKARALIGCDCIILADDSGLVIEALGGNPGIYSARYAGENSTQYQLIEKVLYEMEGVLDRRAHFNCTLAIIFMDGHEQIVEGKLFGEITDVSCGENGFGYDPIFYVSELGKTLAEATSEEKNIVSHRARALLAVKQQLGL